MEFKIPRVYHIAQSSLNWDEVNDYLSDIGAPNWSTDTENDAEYLIELAGRRCYKAFGTELNPNISKVRKGNEDYLGNVLKQKHGSIFEHAYDSFAVENVSRIFTHELVRHRLCSFSQESMRFVRPTALSTLFPQAYLEHLPIDKAERVKDLFIKTFNDIDDIQKELVDICGMDNPETPFTIKKILQSANRRLIPDGVLTGIIFTANHRSWRHMIEVRTSSHAEEEIRFVFYRIFNILRGNYPSIYQDAKIENPSILYNLELGEVKFKNSKI